MTVLSISTAAIGRNYRRLCRETTAEVAAVVKADAYGIGIGSVVPALEQNGCRTYFVNRFDEGKCVRPLTKGRVFVLDSFAEGETPETYKNAGLMPVYSTVSALERFPEEENIAVRFDVGFGLAGIPCGYPVRQSVSLVLGHLSDAEDKNSSKNLEQLNRFKALPYAGKRSLAASYGMALGKEYHFDMIRVGAALYTGEIPVRLTAKVGRLCRFPAGAAIGYGGAVRLERDTLVATLLTGACDGIVHREGCFVVFDGVRLPVLGEPATNYLPVDATAADGKIREGDEVVLFDGTYTPDDLAVDSGTGVGADVLIRLSSAVKRRIVD